MAVLENCPVCGSIALETVLNRPVMPVMQNVVYDTREAALRAPKAPFQLALCTNCGHLFNSLFDANLMAYNERYDNLVPSAAFDAYYLQLARHLVDRYHLEKGLIVDVGCGKGRFLEVLLEQAPGLTGIGIDPALEKEGQEGRIQWVRDIFKPGQLDTTPVLLICRHVLEHMPGPVDFLKSIHGALSGLNVPCFFEVPDAEWIIKNKAYW
ncbi:MAG: methyltransferase domain-containing protein, partial [Fibrobacterota bacterium]